MQTCQSCTGKLKANQFLIGTKYRVRTIFLSVPRPPSQTLARAGIQIAFQPPACPFQVWNG
jgi:hypothetical protein